MQKVSYMGNGSTTEFTFNFPYFENTDIIVTKNGTNATGYNITGNSAGLDADIPYVGGKVVFEVAPTAMDSITIARSLPLTRTVDYQPTVKIDPTTLNQDMNYMMEILKDLQDELDDLRTQYSEIANKDTTATILARISAIHQEITTVRAQITALGDVSEIRNNITTLDTRTSGLIDYVIESQSPTAENNYTWYRKYKSGWVEQGGYVVFGGGGNSVSLPVQMSTTHYHICLTGEHDSGTAGSTTSISTNSGAVTTSGFYVNNYVENGGTRGNGAAFWWMCFGLYDTTI